MWKSILLLGAFAGLVSCSVVTEDDNPKIGPVTLQNEREARSGTAIVPAAPRMERHAGDSGSSHAAWSKAATFAFKEARVLQTIYDGTYEWYDKVWVGDFNDDKRDDLIANTNGGGRLVMKVYTQLANGSLSKPVEYPNSFALAVEDFNEDGVPDIFFAELDLSTSHHTPQILLSDGRGGILRRVVHSQENLPQGIEGVWIPMDVNADGHLDLVQMRNLFEADSSHCANWVPNCVGYLAWFGTGKGAFDRIQVVPLALPLDVHELDTIDLNDDGRKDLVVALSGTGEEAPWVQGSIMVAHALPTGGLGPLKALHPGYNNYAGSLTFADINGDGISDSVMSPQQSKPPEIRLRSLDNTFGPPGALIGYLLFPNVILAEDFDGDRRADLVSTQIVGFGTLGLGYYHQSNGNLDPPTFTLFPGLASSPPLNYDYIKAGDLNGDGCKDIVMAAGDSGLLFFDGSNCAAAPHYRPDETGYVRRKPVGG